MRLVRDRHLTIGAALASEPGFISGPPNLREPALYLWFMRPHGLGVAVWLKVYAVASSGPARSEEGPPPTLQTQIAPPPG